jgi:hypothetical protein
MALIPNQAQGPNRAARPQRCTFKPAWLKTPAVAQVQKGASIRAMAAPARLYKYCSAKVAKVVLRTGCLRLSSPIIFNDPFDCYFAPGFSNIARAVREYRTRLKDIWTGTEALPTNPAIVHRIAPLVQLARDAPCEITTKVIASAGTRVKSIAESTNIRFQHWWETLVPKLRVLCFCEEVSNPLLWSHYAACHAGVAFEFETCDPDDKILRELRPVKYGKRPPRIYSTRDLVESALQLSDLAPLDERALPLVTTKAQEWTYEKEWRSVFVELSASATKLFSDRPFRPNSLSKIFLGCRMSATSCTVVKRLVRENYPHVSVYEASKTSARFGLAFRRVQ